MVHVRRATGSFGNSRTNGRSTGLKVQWYPKTAEDRSVSSSEPSTASSASAALSPSVQAVVDRMISNVFNTSGWYYDLRCDSFDLVCYLAVFLMRS
jgi:hypothetical protein